MENQTTKRNLIGNYNGLKIEIAIWDTVTAEVELSCGCLFSHEVNSAKMQGGLADLNRALNGKIEQMRNLRLFEAARFETLLLDQKQRTIQSPNVLLIGMGSPEDWLAAHTAKAVQIALRAGNQLGVKSVAFAPGLLDTGIKPAEDLSNATLQALIEAYEAYGKLEKLNLVRAATVRHWIFDAGHDKYEAKKDFYIQQFEQIQLHRKNNGNKQ